MAGRRDQFLTGAVERSQEDEAEVVGGGALEEDEAEVVGGGARWKMAGEEAGRRTRGRKRPEDLRQSEEGPVEGWLEKRPEFEEEEEDEAGRGRKI